jgi:hypothetical protein
MSRKPIPERQPIGDPFTGAILQAGITQALALSPLDGADALYDGAMIVRYGVRFLGKPHLSVVPGLVVVDYGDMLTGEEAWIFLTRRSNLYPRAEVFGYRSDGSDEMITVKNLDLALPAEVLVYKDAADNTPVAKPTALIASDEERTAFPPRLIENLPRYPSVAAWQAQTQNSP